MSYYISLNTIKQAFEKLTVVKFENPSILHIFFILKGCGFNNLNYLPDSKIADFGLLPAFKLSSLFSLEEDLPNKYDFINPFEMREWSSQAVSEPLKKWVRSRIKNNVLGGATTWRRIIDLDPKKNEFKFSYDYLNEIKNLTIRNDKINLFALAIWANRFTEFEKKVSLKNIIYLFFKDFQLNNYELKHLAIITSNGISLDYDNSLYDTMTIRKMIGIPEGNQDWLISKEKNDIEYNFNRKEFIVVEDISKISTEKVVNLLKVNKQVIFSGPPATSKSYLANEISQNYDKVEKIQFHPQYNYQDFIGGYIVNGDKVEYRKGLFLNLVEFANANPTKSCLIIIDEINRANASQVFGETLQCLDRNYTVGIIIDGKLEKFLLPKNLHIIATMNTSDRTIGSLDHALKRRFCNIYFAPEPKELLDKTIFESDFSLSDLLERINSKAISILKNKELSIGQAIFYVDDYFNGKIYEWDFKKLEDVFNYKILPMIEDYCYGDTSKIIEIFGEKLPKRLTGVDFRNSIEEFVL